MRRRSALGLLLAVTLTPAVSRATTGGPSTMTVLGYAPVDRKVFVLESFHDESGRPPQLHYLRLDGSRRGVLVPVRSRVPAAADVLDAEAADQARIDRIQRHLVGLARIDRAGFSLTLERERPVHSRDYTDTVWRGWSTRLVVRRHDAAESGAATGIVYRGRRAPRLVHAARVPAQPWAVVVVRYLGYPNELGYERDIAVLVPIAP